MAEGTLLTLLAHPDDETFGTGGTLVRYASEGRRVVVVSATRGEAGENNDPNVGAVEDIGQIRERELRCACDALGVKALYFLNYRDSGMAGTPDNDHPLAFHRADMNEAVGRAVRIVRKEKPHVILTFEPGGGYGHPDHIKVHHVANAAFRAAGDPSRYPEQLEEGLAPWAPSKLYYMAMPRRYFKAISAEMRARGQEPPVIGGTRFEDRGVPDEQVTTEIDVTPYLEAKLAAYQCHRTQLSPNSYMSRLPEDALRKLVGIEYYWRAIPPVDHGSIERDLFAGLKTE